ncbi:unnamed protein product [Vicia faba]|uniref:NB-ARC domain-containing protein n=1 Tax=Vicia faba TaxID=3906 RepID=A0AAV1AD76_VICFA|nr:unnamed protein product [Vicia faba]
MAHKIEKIQKKFNDVKKDMIELNLNPKVVVVEYSNNVKRDTSSCVLESDIIGREDDKNKIVSLLRQPQGNKMSLRLLLLGLVVWERQLLHKCKVVVTTRRKIIAQTMGVNVPYTLKGLNTQEYWSLLKKIVTFGDEIKGLNQNLEPIGIKIEEKCRGVPLAIRHWEAYYRVKMKKINVFLFYKVNFGNYVKMKKASFQC